MMQIGFGLSPFHSGLVTFASAIGAMGMKTLAARIIRTFGFRNILVVNAIVSSIFLAACALFTVTTPLLLIMVILRGRRLLPLAAVHRHQHHRLCRGRAGADEPRHHAGQRLTSSWRFPPASRSARSRVETTMLVRHVTELSATDFAPAFLVVAIISAISAYFFWQMPDDAGHEISGRNAVEIASRKGAAKAAAKAASETTEDARDQRLG